MKKEHINRLFAVIMAGSMMFALSACSSRSIDLAVSEIDSAPNIIEDTTVPEEDASSNAEGDTNTSSSEYTYSGTYRHIIPEGSVVEFNPQGTATIILKDGTQHITYPGSLPQICTQGEEYGEVEFPDISTRDFYIEETKVVYFSEIDDHMYEITGELVSGEEILKYTSDYGHTVPFDFRIFDNKNRIVSIPYTSIDRIEVDNTVTPEFNIGKMAVITLRNGTVYKMPESAVEFMNYTGVIPQPQYMSGLPVRSAEGVQTVPFSALKKVVFTPELIDFEALEDGYPCPGTITYRDGTEMSVDFATGGYYQASLSFFCPYPYLIDLRNNDSYSIGGPYMNESTISEVLSIEFDIDQ